MAKNYEVFFFKFNCKHFGPYSMWLTHNKKYTQVLSVHVVKWLQRYKKKKHITKKKKKLEMLLISYVTSEILVALRILLKLLA